MSEPQTIVERNGASLAYLYAKRNPRCTPEQLVNSYFVSMSEAKAICAKLGTSA